MMSWAWRPISVPAVICSRNISPVEMCGTCMRFPSSRACVPFPAPGGPNKITAPTCFSMAWAMGCDLVRAPPATNLSRLRRETLVMTHDKLRLHLVYRVHCHADHNQQRSAAEVKVHIQSFQEPAGEVLIEKQPHGARQVVQPDSGNQEVRDDREQRQIQAADQGNLR